MRTSIIFASLLFATAALADDTKPPAISGVTAQAKGGKVTVQATITDDTGVLSAVVHHRAGAGGKVEDTPMTKAEYEDRFTATFAGGGDTEYWVEATDLLGNGPSAAGSAKAPLALAASKPSATIASREPAPKPASKKQHAQHTAKAAPARPEIEHRPPAQAAEGQDLTLHAHIRNAAVATVRARPQGSAAEYTNFRMERGAGDDWSAKLPAALAKGSVEYTVLAANAQGERAEAGAGTGAPYVVRFGPPAADARASGPFTFSHYPLVRVQPGAPVVVRAQVVPAQDDGEMPDKVQVLWRGNDGNDEISDMVRDERGGYGGYRAQLPAQPEGALFYSIVACGAQKCAVDTGSKRRWHAAAVSSQPGSAMPLPLDAASAKAPKGLPE